MTAAPIVLVPRFWLGACAWTTSRGVAGEPGSAIDGEHDGSPRRPNRVADRVDVVRQGDRGSVGVDWLETRQRHRGDLVAVGTQRGESDGVPELIPAMVYVDSARGTGASDPDFDGVERPPRGRSSTRRRTSTGSAKSSSRPSGGGPFRSRVESCARPPF
jgi:hypothetical protein